MQLFPILDVCCRPLAVLSMSVSITEPHRRLHLSICRYDQEAPERSPVPEYDQRLSKFQRMCVVKARVSRD